jgi:hypothetical protein
VRTTRRTDHPGGRATSGPAGIAPESDHEAGEMICYGAA